MGQTFKRLGIDVTFVDATDPKKIAAAIRPNTRAVYIESLANPKNDVLDYRAIADVAHAHGLPLVCDNTVLTPILFRPFEHGIDISVYSATKFIGGHGTSLGGVIVDSGRFDWGKEPEKWPQFTQPDPSYHGTVFHQAVGPLCYILTCRTHWLRDLGGALSPLNAFLFLQGLETLHLRMPAHCANGLAVAKFLEAHPSVNRVNYPGLPSHPHYALGAEVPAQGSRLDPRVWDQGRPGGRAEVHRVRQAGLAPGQHRRRQDAGDPSGHHHAQPANPRGTPGRRHCRRLRASQRRFGGQRRSLCRLGSGPSGVAEVSEPGIMQSDRFDSSDSVRNARPLKHVQSVTFSGPFPLELGRELPEVTVAFETYGQLSPCRDNAVLVCHAALGRLAHRQTRCRR